MPFLAAAVGAVAGIGGAALSANAASRTKRKLEELSRTPGIDTGSVSREGIDAYLANLDRAGEASSRSGQIDQESLNAMMEQAAPGFREGQAARTKAAAALSRGELPQDVQDLIYRSSAARSRGAGYAGTGAARNLSLRDLGLTSLDAMQRGSNMVGQIAQSTPLARLRQSYEFNGPTGGDLINLRSNERKLMLEMASGAAQAPGATAVWGNALQQVGSGLMGASGSMGGGGGGGMI